MDRYKLTLEEVVEQAKKHVHYVDTTVKSIGVLATAEAALKAEKSWFVQRLKKKWGYHIQMLIP